MSGPAIETEQLADACAAALDVLDWPILVTNRETVLFANPAAARMLRAKSASELIGLLTDELSHPDCRTTAKLRRDLLEESRQDLCGLPTKVIGRDGSTVCAHTNAHLVEFDGGVAFLYTGGAAVSLDAPNGNGRGLGTHADRHSLFEATLEAIPGIVLIHNAEVILFTNAACRRFLEAQSPEELEDQPVDVIIHPDAYEAGRERRQLLLDGGRPIKGIPLKVVTLDGQARHVIVDAHPLAIDGRIVAAAVIAQAPTQ
jgi:PAS domain S-box-containing protein